MTGSTEPYNGKSMIFIVAHVVMSVQFFLKAAIRAMTRWYDFAGFYSDKYCSPSQNSVGKFLIGVLVINHLFCFASSFVLSNCFEILSEPSLCRFISLAAIAQIVIVFNFLEPFRILLSPFGTIKSTHLASFNRIFVRHDTNLLWG